MPLQQEERADQIQVTRVLEASFAKQKPDTVATGDSFLDRAGCLIVPRKFSVDMVWDTFFPRLFIHAERYHVIFRNDKHSQIFLKLLCQSESVRVLRSFRLLRTPPIPVCQQV